MTTEEDEANRGETVRMRLTIGALRHWLKRQNKWRHFKIENGYHCPVATYLLATTGAYEVWVMVDYVSITFAGEAATQYDLPKPISNYVINVDMGEGNSIRTDDALWVLEEEARHL